MRPYFRSNYGRVESFAKKSRYDLGLSSGPLSRWLCIAFSGLTSVGGCEQLARRLSCKALAELARTATASACSDTRSACRSRGTLRRKSWIAPLDAARRTRLVFKAAADCGVKLICCLTIDEWNHGCARRTRRSAVDRAAGRVQT